MKNEGLVWSILRDVMMVTGKINEKLKVFDVNGKFATIDEV